MTDDIFRVLFVDDDQLVLRSLQRTLRGEPYEAHFASEPVDALRLIGELRVDVVVSDQSMPGMSGIELLGLVRRLHEPVVRVMLTGQADRDVVVEAVNEGHVHRFLEKPWQSGELRAVMRELIGELRCARRAARLACRRCVTTASLAITAA